MTHSLPVSHRSDNHFDGVALPNSIVKLPNKSVAWMKIVPGTSQQYSTQYISKNFLMLLHIYISAIIVCFQLHFQSMTTAIMRTMASSVDNLENYTLNELDCLMQRPMET